MMIWSNFEATGSFGRKGGAGRIEKAKTELFWESFLVVAPFHSHEVKDNVVNLNLDFAKVP